MRVRLVDNGAIAFIPAPFLHAVRDELVCSQENGTVQIKGETVYKVTDVIDVTIAESHGNPQHYCAPGRVISFHGPFLMNGPFISPLYLHHIPAVF
ncbi:S1 RNA-binding domain-containing protein [Escherichia coli]